MGPQSVRDIFRHPKLPILANFLLALIGLFMVYSSGNKMLELPLWGYLPMTFFVGFWLIFNVFFGLIGKQSKSSFYAFLSLISGLLLHAGFPEVSITPLIFLGFLPLLYIVEEQKHEKKGALKVFRYSYSAFLLWNILTTFWVTNTSFLPSIVAFTLNSLFMTIPFMLYFHFRKNFSFKISLVAFVAFWIAFEMIHLRWEISWPWLTLGNAFASRSLWIQWYEYTGHLGGSMWILTMNAMIFHALIKIRDNKKISVLNLMFPMFGLFAPMFISFFVFFGYQEKGEIVNVTLVQPNFEPHYEKFEIPESEQLNRFLKISKANISDTTDYLVYPETSFGAIDVDLIESDRSISELYKLIDSFPNLNIVTGLVTYKIFESQEKGVDNLREIKRNGQIKFLQLHNSSVQLDKAHNFQMHIKGKLVPGAEIFPYSKLLFFLEPIVKKIPGGTISGHARSDTPIVFNGPKANVGASICYESIYGYWMGKFVQNGAELLFVVTNDGWWDDTPGHRQHLGYSVLRAIELRRSIGRSANTGISCVIDQHGRISQTLAYGMEGAINAKMQANKEITFYARNGDIVGRIGLLLSCIFIAFMIRKRIKLQAKK